MERQCFACNETYFTLRMRKIGFNADTDKVQYACPACIAYNQCHPRPNQDTTQWTLACLLADRQDDFSVLRMLPYEVVVHVATYLQSMSYAQMADAYTARQKSTDQILAEWSTDPDYWLPGHAPHQTVIPTRRVDLPLHIDLPWAEHTHKDGDNDDVGKNVDDYSDLPDLEDDDYSDLPDLEDDEPTGVLQPLGVSENVPT